MESGRNLRYVCLDTSRNTAVGHWASLKTHTLACPALRLSLVPSPPLRCTQSWSLQHCTEDAGTAGLMVISILERACPLCCFAALKKNGSARPSAAGVQAAFSLPLLCPTGPQVIFTVFILLWLWLVQVPVPILLLQLLFQPLFQTQLVLRQPVQVSPSLLTS